MRFFGLVLMVLSVSAVKRHEFKTCKDLSFCQRNRFLASTLDYKVSYYVPVQTIQRIWGGIRFNLQSPLEPSPFLKGEAALLTNNALYIYIDEISPMYPRFRTSKDDILNPKTLDFNNNYDVQASQVVWKTGGYKYVLKFDPFSIQGFYKDQLILSVNERSLMNFDRYRSKETVLPHDGNKIIDSTGLPGEFKLWEETWKDFTDSNLRGPSSIGLDITFANTDHVYGIPEHADQMSLRDTVTSEPYRLYNLDVFEFELNERMALYGSVPFMLSVHGGIFWNNPSETWVDVATVKNQKQTHWFSETGVLEFYLFLSDSPKNLVSTFTIFTGPPLLPPLFSLAYHQCRWNYYSQKELLEIEQGFEDHNLPLDVLWLDIEHTPHRTYFTWDYKSFPEPIKMITHLSSHGRKLVNIVDPHLSTNPNFYVNKIFKENGKKLFRFISEN